MLLARTAAAAILGTVMFAGATRPHATPALRMAQMIKAVPTDKKLIAFTFDDGPNRRWTPQVLSLLAQHHAHATFFVIGQEVTRCPDVIQSISRAGMEIGNHGMHHRWLRNLTEEAVKADITGGADAIVAAGGPRPYLYRLPAALADDAARRTLGALHYTVVSWSIDTRDWRRGTSSQRIAQTVMREAAPGKIVIMHDGPAHREATLAALREVLPALQARGYRIVTVGDLLRNSQFAAQRAIPPAPTARKPKAKLVRESRPRSVFPRDWLRRIG